MGRTRRMLARDGVRLRLRMGAVRRVYLAVGEAVRLEPFSSFDAEHGALARAGRVIPTGRMADRSHSGPALDDFWIGGDGSCTIGRQHRQLIRRAVRRLPDDRNGDRLLDNGPVRVRDNKLVRRPSRSRSRDFCERQLVLRHADDHAEQSHHPD